MTRPGLGSLTPGATVAVAGGARTISSGNPNLDPTRATNVDLGFEWYFAEGAMAGLGLFYKDIETSVQTLRENRPYTDSGLPAELLTGTGASPTDDFTFTRPVNTPVANCTAPKRTTRSPSASCRASGRTWACS